MKLSEPRQCPSGHYNIYLERIIHHPGAVAAGRHAVRLERAGGVAGFLFLIAYINRQRPLPLG